jgi:hypothetical protein
LSIVTWRVTFGKGEFLVTRGGGCDTVRASKLSDLESSGEIPMNEKQRVILKALFENANEERTWFKDHYYSFIENMLRELRLAYDEPFWDGWLDADAVTEYFITVASKVDLSESVLTIEQMLYVVVPDIASWRFYPRPYPFERGVVALRAATLLRMPKESAALGEYGDTLVADTDRDLTPEFLTADLTPYLDALRDMQSVVNEIKGYGRSDVVITLIRQRSPVEVNLKGAGEAVDSLKEDIIPWRRKNAKKIADLKAKELEVEIEIKKAEADHVVAKAEKEQAETEKVSVESEKVRWEIEQKKVETDKLRFELKMEKFQLALDMVSKMDPELSYEEKITRAHQMLKSVETLGMSELEFRKVEPRALSDGNEGS